MVRYAFYSIAILLGLLVCISPQSAQAQIMPRAANALGLVAHYIFEDATSTLATDHSGNGNTGTLTNGPVWVSGKHGKAVSFDGVNDYVSGTTTNFTTGTSARTIMGWVNPSTSSATRVLFAYGVCNGVGKVFGAYVDTSDILHFWGCSSADISTGVTLPEETWSHVAVTYDGSSVRVYLNATLVGSPTARTLSSATDFFQIGGASLLDTNNYYFPGIIDSVAVYNRGLTADEIIAAYQKGSARVNASQNLKVTSGLKGLWSFNGPDLTATTAIDRSGQGNNGTLTNGPRPDAGKVGQALRFDGANDRVVIPHSSSIAGGTGSQTFSMWVYINSFPDNSSVTLLSKMYSVVSSEISYSMFIGVDSAFYFQTTNGVNYKLYTAPTTPVTRGGWYHIVFRHTWGSGSSSKLFVNGLPVTGSWTEGTGDDTYTDQSVSLELGRLNHSNTAYEHWLDGILDEVRIHNRLLSDAEITELYVAGR